MVDGLFDVSDRVFVNSDPAQALLVTSLQVVACDSATSVYTWFVPFYHHGGLGDGVHLRSMRLPRSYYRNLKKHIKKIQMTTSVTMLKNFDFENPIFFMKAKFWRNEYQG